MGFRRLIPLVFVLMILLFGFTRCNKRIYDSATIKQLPLAEYLVTMDSTPEAYVLDIRTSGEFNKAHFERAESVSLLSGRFKKEIAELDTSKPVFIYCETAHRSPFATIKLKNAGFKTIYDLDGGYKTYRDSLKSVVE